jgi:hypothetical protein
MSSRALSIFAIFLGPAVCAADQLAGYALSYRASIGGNRDIIYAVTGLAAALIIGGLLLSWRVLRTHQRAAAEGTAGVDRFLGVVGVATNLYFLFVVLVGFGVPQMLLRPTD